MSPVMAIDEWPRMSETTLSGTPRVSITLAAEWRRVWSPACGQAGLRGRGSQRSEGVAWIAGLAELGGEDEAGLPPRRAGKPPFLRLGGRAPGGAAVRPVRRVGRSASTWLTWAR